MADRCSPARRTSSAASCSGRPAGAPVRDGEPHRVQQGPQVRPDGHQPEVAGVQAHRAAPEVVRPAGRVGPRHAVQRRGPPRAARSPCRRRRPGPRPRGRTPRPRPPRRGRPGRAGAPAATTTTRTAPAARPRAPRTPAPRSCRAGRRPRPRPAARPRAAPPGAGRPRCAPRRPARPPRWPGARRRPPPSRRARGGTGEDARPPGPPSTLAPTAPSAATRRTAAPAPRCGAPGSDPAGVRQPRPRAGLGERPATRAAPADQATRPAAREAPDELVHRRGAGRRPLTRPGRARRLPGRQPAGPRRVQHRHQGRSTRDGVVVAPVPSQPHSPEDPAPPVGAPLDRDHHVDGGPQLEQRGAGSIPAVPARATTRTGTSSGRAACRVAAPACPAPMASSSSRTSGPRHSPTTSRSGRIRRAWRTRTSRPTWPGTLDVARPGLQRDDVRVPRGELGRVLDDDDPFPGPDERQQGRQQRRLAGPGRSRDEQAAARRDHLAQRGRQRRRDRAPPAQLVEVDPGGGGTRRLRCVPPRQRTGRTACSRTPDGSRASTQGLASSRRRPPAAASRTASARTCSSVSRPATTARRSPPGPSHHTRPAPLTRTSVTPSASSSARRGPVSSPVSAGTGPPCPSSSCSHRRAQRRSGLRPCTANASPRSRAAASPGSPTTTSTRCSGPTAEAGRTGQEVEPGPHGRGGVGAAQPARGRTPQQQVQLADRAPATQHRRGRGHGPHLPRADAQQDVGRGRARRRRRRDGSSPPARAGQVEHHEVVLVDRGADHGPDRRGLRGGPPTPGQDRHAVGLGQRRRQPACGQGRADVVQVGPPQPGQLLGPHRQVDAGPEGVQVHERDPPSRRGGRGGQGDGRGRGPGTAARADDGDAAAPGPDGPARAGRPASRRPRAAARRARPRPPPRAARPPDRGRPRSRVRLPTSSRPRGRRGDPGPGAPPGGPPGWTRTTPDLRGAAPAAAAARASSRTRAAAAQAAGSGTSSRTSGVTATSRHAASRNDRTSGSRARTSTPPRGTPRLLAAGEVVRPLPAPWSLLTWPLPRPVGRRTQTSIEPRTSGQGGPEAVGWGARARLLAVDTGAGRVPAGIGAVPAGGTQGPPDPARRGGRGPGPQGWGKPCGECGGNPAFKQQPRRGLPRAVSPGAGPTRRCAPGHRGVGGRAVGAGAP